jgi:hypothetical protein
MDAFLELFLWPCSLAAASALPALVRKQFRTALALTLIGPVVVVAIPFITALALTELMGPVMPLLVGYLTAWPASILFTLVSLLIIFTQPAKLSRAHV